MMEHTAVAGHRPQWRIGLADLVVSLSLLTVYSGAQNFVNSNVNDAIKPLYLYGALYVASLWLLLAYGRLPRVDQRVALVSSLLLFHIVMLSAQAIFFPLGDAAWESLTGRLHFVFTALATVIALGFCSSANLVRLALVAVVAASSTINILEALYFGPEFGWMSKVAGRAAGLYIDPNDSAMFISMALPIVLYGRSSRARTALYALSLFGVLLTFSRGGIVIWTAAVVATEMLSLRRRISLSRAVLPLVGVALLLLILSAYQDELLLYLRSILGDFVGDDIAARVSMASTESGEERLSLLASGWDAFIQSPLAGHGLGYTFIWDRPVSVHNVFLRVLVEQGILGGIWLLAFLWAVWRCSWPFGATFALLFTISGMFSHNHFERPSMAILMVMYLLAASFARGDMGQAKHQR